MEHRRQISATTASTSVNQEVKSSIDEEKEQATLKGEIFKFSFIEIIKTELAALPKKTDKNKDELIRRQINILSMMPIHLVHIIDFTLFNKRAVFQYAERTLVH